MKPMMRWAERAISALKPWLIPSKNPVMAWAERAIGALAFVGLLATAGLVLVTIVSVFWRYVLGDPLFGIEDVSRMTLAVAVAGSLAYGARRGAHVYVDAITLFFDNQRFLRWSDSFARLLGCVILALAAFALFQGGRCGFKCGDFTDNLNIIHTPFYWLLSLGVGLYALVLLLEFIDLAFLGGRAYASQDADDRETAESKP